MRFLVDAQLPPALSRYLCELGHISEHVDDLGMMEAEDSSIWDYALEGGFVILTKDEDFAYRFSQKSVNAPVIIWLRIGNCSRRALIGWFGDLLPDVLRLLKQGERLIEVK